MSARGLSDLQLKARDGKLTASRVGVLMSGDPEKIMALWQEMTGQSEPEDLSAVWAVQLGSHTESLNLEWYERKTGHTLTLKGEVLTMDPWAAATLDGYDAEINAVVEAKHVGGFEPRDNVVARYMPQVHWQMLVSGARLAVLSLIEGAREPVFEHVEFDEAYAAELWARAEQFMRCVEDLIPPVEFAPVAAPTRPEQYRTVDMTGSNAWASLAGDWLANQSAAKTFDKAAKEIKALVEIDVGQVSGHGIQCKRSKAGSLTISATKG